MTDSLLSYSPFIITALLFLWFASSRGLALMMFFQQEEYDGTRFVHWLKAKAGYDKATTFWLLAATASGVISHLLLPSGSTEPSYPAILGWVFVWTGLIHGSAKSAATRQNNKKPLVMTPRAQRIYGIFLLLTVLCAGLIYLASRLAPRGAHYSLQVDMSAESLWDTVGFANLSYDWRTVSLFLLLILLVQTLPVLLVAANKLLDPMEERVKAKFRAEAVTKFTALAPKVIAITGSFGKTSTKHILSHILEAAAPTLSTPGSVNTEMGITRVIREKLEPGHQYFIVEMGAYGPGSIARLCKLTPPDSGLITAVGAAHYERFKSLETVSRAKFELAEAVFQKSGQVVVSTDGIDKGLLAERTKDVPGDYLYVGTEGDIVLTNLTQDKGGLTLTVKTEDGPETLKVPLFGKHQADNILLAASAARTLGLPWSAIKGALASMPQIRHRLEVTQQNGGATILNDAYNSNPIGFASALEALDVLVEKGGRRILITPGMVELGSQHDSEHERLGRLAAQHCDIVAIVTPARIPTFVKGLNAANNGTTTVMTFETQNEAEEWVKSHWRAADAVLFENNLPDLYEATVNF